MNKDIAISTLKRKYYNHEINIFVINNQIWVMGKTIAEIFSIENSYVHLLCHEIFNDGELDLNEHFQSININNNNESCYSIDAIISIGYRVNTKKGTQFRLWSNGLLKNYLNDGYNLNENLLLSDPSKLNSLAAKIRELRADEKNIYLSVRECFKIASSDYEPSSSEVRKFYALLQDKFHHAITNMSSRKLLLDRADHSKKNMGLNLTKKAIPTKKEIQNGKNYLSESEIYRMHLLSEQFLLYAESTALSNKKMTMKELHNQLDNLLVLNGYEVFGGKDASLKKIAFEHAIKERDVFINIEKLRYLLGIEIDLEGFYSGEYDEYKEEIKKISLHRLNKWREAA